MKTVTLKKQSISLWMKVRWREFVTAICWLKFSIISCICLFYRRNTSVFLLRSAFCLQWLLLPLCREFYIWPSVGGCCFFVFWFYSYTVFWMSSTHVLNFTSALRIAFVCLFLARQPPVEQGLLIHEVSILHTTTHYSRQDSSGRVISSSQRPLPDNTHNTHNRHTSMPPVGFEPIILLGERPQTARLLGRTRNVVLSWNKWWLHFQCL